MDNDFRPFQGVGHRLGQGQEAQGLDQVQVAQEAQELDQIEFRAVVAQIEAQCSEVTAQGEEEAQPHHVEEAAHNDQEAAQDTEPTIAGTMEILQNCSTVASAWLHDDTIPAEVRAKIETFVLMNTVNISYLHARTVAVFELRDFQQMVAIGFSELR